MRHNYAEYNQVNLAQSHGWNGILTRWAVTYLNDFTRFVYGVNAKLIRQSYKIKYILTEALYKAITNPLHTYERRAQQVGSRLNTMHQEFDAVSIKFTLHTVDKQLGCNIYW